MRFKSRNIRQVAELVIGDADHFPYRSSSYITQFFEECDLDFVHDGTTRWAWTTEKLSELLNEPQPTPHALPERFVHVLRVLMHKPDALESDPDRSLALEALNKPLSREGTKPSTERTICSTYVTAEPRIFRQLPTRIDRSRRKKLSGENSFFDTWMRALRTN